MNEKLEAQLTLMIDRYYQIYGETVFPNMINLVCQELTFIIQTMTNWSNTFGVALDIDLEKAILEKIKEIAHEKSKNAGGVPATAGDVLSVAVYQ